MMPGNNGPDVEAAFYHLIASGKTPEWFKLMYQMHTGKCAPCNGHGWQVGDEGKTHCLVCKATGRVLQLG